MMINDRELELINRLSSVIGESAGFVIGQYSTWFIAAAVGWVGFGCLLVYAAIKISFDEESGPPVFFQGLIRAVIAFVAALFIFINVPDLVAPKAAAIHQIMKDLHPTQR